MNFCSVWLRLGWDEWVGLFVGFGLEGLVWVRLGWVQLGGVIGLALVKLSATNNQDY